MNDPYLHKQWAIGLLITLLITGVAQGALNVRDFGAKGDGETDDTAAIRQAIAAKKANTGFARPKRSAYRSSSELFFPQGSYLISDSLDITGLSTIRGEGKAILKQTNPEKDILVGLATHRILIEGLTFVDGRDHVVLGNGNADKSNFKIHDCSFMNAGGVAIRIGEKAFSTLLDIEGGVFVYCQQVLVTYCDETLFQNSWITTADEMENRAAIENRGLWLRLANITGVPRTGRADQRWIDNYGSQVHCRDVRFGGEGGGFTAIVNFSKYRDGRYPLTQIILENCWLFCLNNEKRKGAVYCEEVPNQILIRGCQYSSAPLLVSPSIDLSTYFIDVREHALDFQVEHCVGGVPFQMPEGLKQPVIHQRPRGGLTAAEVDELIKRAKQRLDSLPAPPAKPYVAAGHTQKTAPGSFRSLLPDQERWSLDDLMDARTETNADYLAFAQHKNEVILMRRLPSGDNWPHILIQNVEADLDRHPFLTLKIRDIGLTNPVKIAMKVLDHESQALIKVPLPSNRPWFDYHAFYLPDLLKQTGRRKLDIKLYYLASENLAGGRTERSQSGDYAALEFLRLEER